MRRTRWQQFRRCFIDSRMDDPFSGLRRQIGWKRFLRIVKLDNEPLGAKTLAKDDFESLNVHTTVCFLNDWWRLGDRDKVITMLEIMHAERAAAVLAEWRRLSQCFSHRFSFPEELLSSLDRNKCLAIISNHAGLASLVLERAPLKDILHFQERALTAFYDIPPGYGTGNEKIAVAMERSGASHIMASDLTRKLTVADDEELAEVLRTWRSVQFLQWTSQNLDAKLVERFFLNLGVANICSLVTLAAETQDEQLRALGLKRIVAIAKDDKSRKALKGHHVEGEYDHSRSSCNRTSASSLARVVGLIGLKQCGEVSVLLDELAERIPVREKDVDKKACWEAVGEMRLRDEVAKRLGHVGNDLVHVSIEQVIWHVKNSKYERVREGALDQLSRRAESFFPPRAFTYYIKRESPERIPPLIAQARRKAGELGVDESLLVAVVAGSPQVKGITRTLGKADGARVVKELDRTALTEWEEISDWDQHGSYEQSFTRRVSVRRLMETVSNWEEREKTYAVLKAFGIMAIPPVLDSLKTDTQHDQSQGDYSKEFRRGRSIRLLTELRSLADAETQHQIDKAISAARAKTCDEDLVPVKKTFEKETAEDEYL